MQIKHTEKPPKRQSKPHPKTNLNAALKHAKAGLSVFPARPTNKRPYLKGWQDVATTSEAKIRQWWTKWPGAVPALPTGKKNGIAVMDIDRKNGKDGFEGLCKLGYDPRTLSELQCVTPSGGAHLYFKWRKGMGNSAAGLPVGVDIRGEGGFVIAPGAVMKSGRYKPKGMMLVSGLSGLQKWPKALRPKKPKANAKSNPTGLPLNVLRSALMAIPNNNPDRDWWLAMGAALHFETGGSTEGLTVWHKWSATYGDYDHAHTEQVWHSFKRQGGNLVTGKTILAEAQKHGWRDTSLLDYLEEDIKPDARIKSGVRLLSPDNCAALPPRDYLLKGLIAPQNICCIFGDPGAGKSLIGPSLGYALAQGRDAFGMRTKPGIVFYVAAEDETGMAFRIRALRKEHDNADNFQLVMGVSDLFTPNGGDLNALWKLVKQHKPALILIDTLAMAFPGLEENNSEPMVRVIATGKALARKGAAVIFIHHGTKADGTTPRGHSAFNGALDMALHLKAKDAQGVIRGKLTKNRNGSLDRDIAFRIGTHSVGEDIDGDVIEAPFAVELAQGAASTAVKLSPSAAAALSVLTDLANTQDGVPETDWRKACVNGRTVSAATKEDDRRRTFKRAAEELTRTGKVRFSEGNFHLSNSGTDLRDYLTEDVSNAPI